jgi:hypothetical protein
MKEEIMKEKEFGERPGTERMLLDFRSSRGEA